MTGLEYGLFDCDTHCYETRDSFTRYLPKQWQQHAIAPVRAPARPPTSPFPPAPRAPQKTCPARQ